MAINTTNIFMVLANTLLERGEDGENVARELAQAFAWIVKEGTEETPQYELARSMEEEAYLDTLEHSIFSAQHYNYVADKILHENSPLEDRFVAVRMGLKWFAADNPKFNTYRFASACLTSAELVYFKSLPSLVALL